MLSIEGILVMDAQTTKTLANHDVSDLIGLHVVVIGVAVEKTNEAGETCIEIPNIEEASAAAAVARCLMQERLRGNEIKAIRRIAGMTAAEMAEKMDTKASPETLSRWENEKQPMGGYAEKVFRLVVCDLLHKLAPGVKYTDGSIAQLVLLDPWRVDPDYKVPPVVLERVRMLSEDRALINAWGTEQMMAA